MVYLATWFNHLFMLFKNVSCGNKRFNSWIFFLLFFMKKKMTCHVNMLVQLLALVETLKFFFRGKWGTWKLPQQSQLDTVITYTRMILTDRNGQVLRGWGEFNGQSVVALLTLMVYLATWFIICLCYLKMRLVVTKDSILESFFFFCFHEKKRLVM